MSNGIQGTPQTRQAWLDVAGNHKEIRGKADGEGGLEVYGSKRSILGKMLSFIKDPMFATEREAKRSAGAAAFREFVSETSGLTREQVQDIFARAGVVAGRPLRRDAMERVFAEVDAAANRIPEPEPGQAPPPAHDAVPPPPPRPLDRGLLDLERMPQDLRDGLEATDGITTQPMVEWMLRSGTMDLDIDLDDPNLQVRELVRDGGQTLALYEITAGDKAYIVKETGNQAMDLGDAKLYPALEQVDGVWDNPAYFEDHKLQVVKDSVMGSMGTIEGPGGVRFQLADTVATLRYVPEQRVTIMHNRGETPDQLLTHQVSVFVKAPGIGMHHIFDRGEEALPEKIEAARNMGRAIGAFHLQYSTGEVMPTGGLRTIVHGDFHPSNMYWDEEARTVTGIDLAGASANFIQLDGSPRDPPGFDMLRDVKRTMWSGRIYTEGDKQPGIKDAFLEGYAENFAHMTHPDGGPMFSVDRIRELVRQDSPLESDALT